MSVVLRGGAGLVMRLPLLDPPKEDELFDDYPSWEVEADPTGAEEASSRPPTKGNQIAYGRAATGQRFAGTAPGTLQRRLRCTTASPMNKRPQERCRTCDILGGWCFATPDITSVSPGNNQRFRNLGGLVRELTQHYSQPTPQFS
ncbi:hypothetical protein MRX96_026455 [Rhipicephalus microplus]